MEIFPVVPWKRWSALLSLALFVLCISLLVTPFAFAADRYWASAGVSNQWEASGNWASVPKGAGGASVPGVNDVVIFNTSGSTARIYSAVRIRGLFLSNVFTGSVLQGTGSITVGTGSLRVGSGRLTWGSSVFALSGSYTQTGGIVTMQNLTLSGAFSVTDGAVRGQPVFNSTGTLILDSSVDQAFTVGAGTATGTTITALTVRDSGGGTNDDITVTAPGGLNMSGTLTITQGNLDVGTNDVALVVDDGDITLANDAQATLTTDVAVSHSGGLTVNYLAGFALTGGTWTVRSDNDETYTINGPAKRFFGLTLANSGATANNDIVLAGSGLNVSGSLLIQVGSLDLTTNSQAAIVDDGDILVNNKTTASFETNSAVSHSGTLTIDYLAPFALTAGTWTVRADNDKTYRLGGPAKRFFSLTLANSGATANNDIVLAGSGLNISGSLLIQAGSLDLATNSQAAIVDDGDITVNNKTTASFETNSAVSHSGALTIDYLAPFALTAGTWTANADNDKTYRLGGPAKRFFSLTLNNAGAAGNNDYVLAGSGLNLSGALLTITLGSLDLATNSQAAIVDDGDITIADSAQASFETNSAVTHSGALTVNYLAPFALTAGTWIANADNDKTYRLNGPAKRFFSLTLANSGATANNDIVLAGSGLNVSGTLLIQAGSLDLASNSQAAIVDDGDITVNNKTTASFETNSAVSHSGALTIDYLAPFALTAGTWTVRADNDKTYRLGGPAKRFFSLTLANSGATANNDIVLAGSGLNISGSLLIQAGSLDLASNSQAAIVDDGDITVNNKTTASFETNSAVSHSGALTVDALAGFSLTAGTWTAMMDNDKTYTLAGGNKRFFSLTLTNSGSNTAGVNDLILAGAGLNVSGSLLIQVGSLDLATNDQFLNIDDGDITVNNKAAATFETDASVTHSGALTVDYLAGFALTGGTWVVEADNDKTYRLNGPAKRFFHLVITNSGATANNDTVLAGSGLNLSGTLTINDGTLDLATNNQAMVVDDGNITLADTALAELSWDQNISHSGALTVSSSAIFTGTGGTWTIMADNDKTYVLNGSNKRFFHLTLANSGATANNDITVTGGGLNVSGSLVIQNGSLDLDTLNQALIVDDGAIEVHNRSTASLETDANVTHSGSLTVLYGGAFDLGGGTWTQLGDNDATYRLNGSTKRFYGLTLNNTGGGSNDDIAFAGSGLNVKSVLTVTRGNLDLDTNAQALDLDSHLVIADHAQATMSGANMNIAGDITKNDAGGFTNLGGTVTLDGTSQVFSGSLTLNNLTKVISATAMLSFAPAKTVTILGTLSLVFNPGGGGANVMNLRSSTSGVQWRIDPRGTRDLRYVDVKDSNNTNATALNCPTNLCVDSGNNTNWTFAQVGGGGGGTESPGGGGRGGGGGGGGGRVTSTSMATPTPQREEGRGEVEVVAPPAAVPGELPEMRGKLWMEVEGKNLLFKDVPVKEWFAQYVYVVVNNGIASGYKDARGRLTGEYGPANNVTYAEIAKMALEAAGADSESVEGGPRNRSARGEWSEKYIALAEGMGLSVYDARLDVNTPAPRGAVIQTIMEALGIPLGDSVGDYIDVDADHAHVLAIGKATELGIVSGDTDRRGNRTGTFRPDDSVNRAEVAKIMANVLELGAQ